MENIVEHFFWSKTSAQEAEEMLTSEKFKSGKENNPFKTIQTNSNQIEDLFIESVRRAKEAKNESNNQVETPEPVNDQFEEVLGTEVFYGALENNGDKEEAFEINIVEESNAASIFQNIQEIVGILDSGSKKEGSAEPAEPLADLPEPPIDIEEDPVTG